ncbi:MAG: DUF2335 domain-containing protein [Acidobacteriia bacterium]|nr:DUF2335 domain-containing protein [Terriglobia bacterium]
MSPEERRREAAAIREAAIEISRYHSGPLPPPEDLAKYEQILAGAADRIIRMAEQQSTHRQHLEKVAIESNASTQKWGLVCAFIIAMSAIWGGIWLSLKGMSGAGLATIIGALVALVAVFVYGKSGQKKELQKKAEELMPIHDSPSTPSSTHS